jgi:hypothetical protein
MAADMDSPFAVTSAESAVMGIMRSRDVGRDTSFFQGPGESPDIRGDGKGVTSAIAFSIGEDRAEPGRDPAFELLPMLLAKTFLMLGVRASGAIGILGVLATEGMRVDSLELRAVLLFVEGVTLQLGRVMSVWIRSPALRGLEYPSRESVGRRRWEVSTARFAWSFEGVELCGGEGAIVLDLKMAAVMGV